VPGALRRRSGCRPWIPFLAILLVGLCLAAGCVALGPRPRPIVLIVVDTLRADHLGAYGYARPASPHLDAWSRRGRLYDHAYATAPWTLPSFGSLFTGQLPSRHGAGLRRMRQEGIAEFLVLDPALPTLAGRLQRGGYTTGALMNNVFLDRRFGVQRGFGSVDYAREKDGHRPAREVVRRALAWIDAQKSQRFFLLVHMMDPHMPYDPPADVRGRFTACCETKLSLPVRDGGDIRRELPDLSAQDRDFVAAAYDEEILGLDEQLDVLLRGLEQRGVLDAGLVVLTADHGEELFEHGSFEHGHAMWEELLHVPLIFWGRDVLPGREGGRLSLVDLMPTLLEAVGLRVPEDLEGVSAWPNLVREAPLRQRTLFAETVLYGPDRRVAMLGPYKLESLPDAGWRRLFDLRDEPREVRNVGAEHPRLAKRLLRRMNHHLEQLAAERPPQKPASIDAEMRAKLKALGYRLSP
jgi:arylsulfatase A-like enzyme